VSFYGNQWELYNIANDRGEQNDLDASYPEKVEKLAAQWHEMAENTDRLSKKQSAPVKSTPSPNSKNTWHNREIHQEWKMPQF